MAALLALAIWMGSPNDNWAQTVTLQNGYNFVGCSVNGPGGNNINNASFLYGPGLVSDPNGAHNTLLYVWNCANQSFVTYQYYSAQDAGGAAGWYDLVGNYVNIVWNPGEGMILENFTAPASITLDGTPATPVYPPLNYCGCGRWSLLAPQNTNA